MTCRVTTWSRAWSPPAGSALPTTSRPRARSCAPTPPATSPARSSHRTAGPWCEGRRDLDPAVDDADRRVAFRLRRVDDVVGDAGEHLFEHHLDDHAREVDAEAAVRAGAEGQVRVRRAVDVDVF